MTIHHSITAYWFGYECSLRNKPKPRSEKFQTDVDQGWQDAKTDVAKGMQEYFKMIEESVR